MVQIYKSHIADLLRCEEDPILALHLDFEADGSVSIRNVIHRKAFGFLDKGGDKNLINIINRGLDNRLMRSTEKNEASSRSHLLFAVTFSYWNQFTETMRSGKMMFVDLAGSERLAQLGFTLLLYEEAIFINESLAVLGRILFKLTKQYAKEKIDYNCNILTSLLKDTVGGDSSTLMYICLSPSVADIEATRDTLRFAKSTGKIKSKPGLIPVLDEIHSNFNRTTRVETS